MKSFSTFVLVSLLAASFSQIHAAEDCCAPAVVPSAGHAGIDVGGCYGKPEPLPAPFTAVGHPLKGVVIDVLADKSALLVKHEEIPGIMKAMTMLLQVDAATFKSPAATKGAAITGLLVRKTDGWWLEEVAASPAK